MRVQKYSILIAEDDFLVKKAIIKALEETSCKLIGVASDGMEAVEKTVSLKPDAVLMDIRMPGLDGLAATRIIQQKQPTPVVILTAYESPDLLDQATDAGASGYLVKPPKTEAIERSVIMAIARHRDFMELCRMNAQLEAALAEIKTLRGILPICAYCKGVRDDAGYWHAVEEYLAKQGDVEFSHGICPKCYDKMVTQFSTHLSSEVGRK